MKILYATQATGNGHISRATEIIPLLKKRHQTEVLISGYNSSLKVDFEVDHKMRGLSFYQGNNGKIDYLKTLSAFQPKRFLRDVHSFDIQSYDLIINDFEPVSAWAARLKHVPSIALSHQSSFYSSKTPRPEKRSHIAEMGLKYFAPADDFIGFHFMNYDTRIEKPIIRKEIRALEVEEQDHITVYLPSFSDEKLVDYFQQIPQFRFKVFSKDCKQKYSTKNIDLYPVGKSEWLESFRTAHAVIMGAGFEGPAEAMYLGKRLIVCPLIGQYEQLCNAVALEKMSIPVFHQFNQQGLEIIREGIFQRAIQQDYPDRTDLIVDKLLAVAATKSLGDKDTQFAFS